MKFSHSIGVVILALLLSATAKQPAASTTPSACDRNLYYFEVSFDQRQCVNQNRFDHHLFALGLWPASYEEQGECTLWELVYFSDGRNPSWCRSEADVSRMQRQIAAYPGVSTVTLRALSR